MTMRHVIGGIGVLVALFGLLFTLQGFGQLRDFLLQLSDCRLLIHQSSVKLIITFL